MSYEVHDHLKEGKVNHLPKRGDIKAKIFGNLVRSVITLASKKGGRQTRRQEGGYSTSTTPTLSGYSSEASSDA